MTFSKGQNCSDKEPLSVAAWVRGRFHYKDSTREFSECDRAILNLDSGGAETNLYVY